MWFWIGLALILLWGGWGYWRRNWWLSAIDRSLREAGDGTRLVHAPPRLPDRIVTVVAGAAAIIGTFLVIASRWGWFE